MIGVCGGNAALSQSAICHLAARARKHSGMTTALSLAQGTIAQATLAQVGLQISIRHMLVTAAQAGVHGCQLAQSLALYPDCSLHPL